MAKTKTNKSLDLPIDTRLVKFKNRLNRILWKNLDSPSTKLLTCILASYSQALQHNPHIVSIEISGDALKKRMGYSGNHPISEYVWSLKSALQKWHEIHVGSVDTSFVLFPTIERDKKRGMFRFTLNPTLINLLLFDPKEGRYIAYPEHSVMNMDSVSGMTLYRLLKGVRTTGWWQVPKFTGTNDKGKLRIGLWDQLGASKTMHESDFQRWLLVPAIMQACPYFTSLDYKKIYGTVKGHRRVTGYKFTFEPENKQLEKTMPKAKALANIKSTKCLTSTQKYKAVDKYFKLKIGTTRKKARKGIDVFAISAEHRQEQLSLFADADTAKINLAWQDKGLARKAQKADAEQLQSMIRHMEAKKNKAPAQINDLMLLKRLAGRRNKR